MLGDNINILFLTEEFTFILKYNTILKVLSFFFIVINLKKKFIKLLLLKKNSS